MASGLKVNASKTRVFFSKNVNHVKRTELCSLLGFQVTPDLGKYLGVPIHHKRVSKRCYQGIVDKVRIRLANWKATSLSLAGRTTLISSVTSAIPGYTMQSVYLPKATCDDIEKQNRKFLWGSTPEKKKTHLVAWDTVCKPKKKGGLGLKHLHCQNQAFMMKLGWNLMTKRDSLWVRVMRSKYMCGDDLIPNVEADRRGSNAWTGIKRTWESVVAGSLVDTQSGAVRWKHERSGVFSIKSAYDVLNASPEGEERSWQHLWKMGIVPRCKSFMWLALQNKLLTNEERVRRSMGGESTCSWCGVASENLVHVLRDCRETRQLWVAVVDPRYLHRFFQSDLLGWIRGNIHRVQDRGKEDWGVLFCTLCWMIWQRRNSRIFENVILSNEAILYRANSIIATVKSARDRMRGVNLNGRTVGIRDEGWEPPDRGWVKCNVDGASTHDLLATCGGVLRDEHGSLIGGFMFKAAEPADSLLAELQAVLLGVKMCWDSGKRNVIMETDAEEVVSLINNPCQSSHPDMWIIQEIKKMIDREWEMRMRWIPREANRAADYVTKQAFNVWPGMHQFHVTFGGLDEFLCMDMAHAGISSGIG